MVKTIATLIYQESQLRKAEAVYRCCCCCCNRIREESSNMKIHSKDIWCDYCCSQRWCIVQQKLVSRERSTPKRRKYRCTNKAQKGGVCIKHDGAEVKLCKSEGCTNIVQIEGVCMKHGLSKVKLKRCTSYAQRGGVCMKDQRSNKQQGCKAEKGGMCMKHCKG